jgi:hypothetical protein
MKIYSDISLIDASSSISSDQNIYVLVRGNDGTIRKAPLTVNSVPMSANGNIAANLTSVITGLSSSLSGSPLFLSDAYTPRPPVSGTLFVVSGETGDNVGKNGEAYIFVTSSTQNGQWQQIFGFNFVAADARYVRLASTSSQSISSSLNITGSIYWNSGSGAVFPAASVTASVVVLGDDNKLYITGAYGVGGGGGTPSAPLNSVQFNNNSTFGGNETFTFIPPTTSSIPSSSGLLSLLGRETISGSLILRNPADISGSIYTASAWTSSLTLQVIGTSSFTGSVSISSSLTSSNALQVIGSTTMSSSLTGLSARTVLNITGPADSSSLIVSGSTVLRNGTTTIQGNSATTGNVLLINNSTPTNILTISSNRTSSFNGNTFITGALVVSRSIDNTVNIVGSGSATGLLNVLGSQGQLFSVYDTLSGSLFSVNDISGLPILEVFSDSTTLIGNYQAPALHTSRRIITTVGNNTIYNGIPTASYNAAIIDYNLTSASCAKVGSIMTAWSGSFISTQTEYATASFGSVNFPTMSLQISGANLIITASAAAANWVIKTIIRSI